MKDLRNLSHEKKVQSLMEDICLLTKENDTKVLHLFDDNDKEYARAIVSWREKEIRLMQRPTMYFLVIEQDGEPKEYISKGPAKEVAEKIVTFAEREKLAMREASEKEEDEEKER